ncbi:unnamed protein product [Orchesella dallaii]|uniref:Ig-like domain-containing protein n=1 Tax=Orchesella dallaii TaxID=48710 RepID=A0ABP1RFS4_9HEXA
MVLSELSSLSLTPEVRRWKPTGASGFGTSCSNNLLGNYHSSMSTIPSSNWRRGGGSSCSSNTKMMSFSSYYRGGARFVESTAILKVMELLGSLRWIFLLILLTDSVIGHASDGRGMSQSSDSSFLSASRGPTFSTSFGLELPVVAASISDSGSSVHSNLVGGEVSLSRQRRAPAGDRDLASVTAGATVTNAELRKSSTENTSTLAHHDSNGVQQEQESLQPTSNYPYIDKAASPNVTALLGKTAYLTCQVKNLGDKTVSWVRHRDIHLLTVGRYTYTTDQRFRALLQPNSDDYMLQIKYPQHRDAGIYECQVSTTPHLSHYVHLGVVEPVTEVIGGPDLFIDRGSTINLTCTVKHSPEPPSYIIWNHNNAIISYSSPRGGVSVLTEKGPTTTSYLLIQQAKPTDSGRYSCNPSNAVPHSIVVHVLNGELPAAMHTGGQTTVDVSLPLTILLDVIAIFIAVTC